MLMAPPRPDWARDGAEWPNREASRFRRAGRLEWHLQRAGAGPRILLLHGSGAATHSWRDLFPLLTAQAEVLAPDLPGHGFTSSPRSDLSLPRVARDVAELLAAEDFVPDLTVGHSAGGAIALRLALDAGGPARITALNAAVTPFRGASGAVFPLLARAFALNPLTPRLLARMADESAVRRLLDGTGSRIDARGTDLYRRLISSPGHVRGTLEMMADWRLQPLFDALPRLTGRLLLAVGEKDRTIPPSAARRVAARCPVAEIRAFPYGHLMHEEAPETFARLILDELPDHEDPQKDRVS